MQVDERRTRRPWMLASVITGSGLIISHVDVVHAAPIETTPSSSADIPTESTTARPAPATTQWPAPESTERVVTATTQWPTPTAPADATTTPTTTATTVATSVAAPSTSPDDVGTGLAPVPAADAGAIVAQGGPVLPAADQPAAEQRAAGTSAATGSLPVTGQSIELPVGSGIALALIGAALLRLRRRPSWD